MFQVCVPPHGPRNHPTMDTREDTELLQEIALRKDREAYAELYARYEKRAFNLSRYLTGQRELAKDAVQEAMLAVWLSAASFQPGNAQGWIMRIVALKSLKLAQKQRAQRERTGSEENVMPASNATSPETAEQGELLSALRSALDRLPLPERQVVALHFGAELSQEEIGAALGATQQAISYRLKRALETLRENLARAGFAAAAPWLGAAGLHQALTSGLEAPAGLRERVLEGLAQAARGSLRASRRAALAGSKGPGLLLPAGLLLAAAASVTWWWASASRPAVPQTPAPSEPSQAVPASPAPTALQAEPFFRRWDFNSPEQARDFKVGAGAWHHVPGGGEDGSGCMETDTEIFAAELNFPGLDHTRPYSIASRYFPILPQPASRSGYYMGVHWHPCIRIAFFHNAGNIFIFSQSPQNAKWVHTKDYMFDGWADLWAEGRRNSIQLFEGLSKPHLLLGGRGRQRFDDLEIREIKPQELPDISAYSAALEKIDPARRTGTVVLPDLPCPVPGKEVSVEFTSSQEAEPGQRKAP